MIFHKHFLILHLFGYVFLSFLNLKEYNITSLLVTVQTNWKTALAKLHNVNAETISKKQKQMRKRHQKRARSFFFFEKTNESLKIFDKKGYNERIEKDSERNALESF